MQNNFSKCREWVPRGTSQHKWRWLTTLLLILTLGIGQMWATLTAHTPGIYEKTVATGGYGCTLTTVASGTNAGTFEVYYFSANSKYGNTTDVYGGGDRQQYRLMCADNNSEYQLINRNGTGTFTASCDWIEMAYTVTGFSKSDYTYSSAFNEFFATAPNGGNTSNTKTCYIKPKEGDVLTLKVSGYVEFAILGADNGSSKYMTVAVDGGTPTSWKSNTLSRRSVTLTTGEHTIVVANVGSSANNFYGFSLKLPSCDGSNASIIDDQAIYVNDALDLEFSSDNVNTVSYSIKKGGSATSDASVTDGVFKATAAGTYVVTATQAKDASNHCAVEESVTITVNAKTPVASVSISGDATAFIGMAKTLTASADQAVSEYKWEVDGVDQGVNAATFNFSAAAAGTYSVVCKARNSFNDPGEYISSSAHSITVTKLCGELIRATRNGKNLDPVTGVVGGTATKNTQDGGKLGSSGHYWKLVLASGNFMIGDVVTVNVSTAAGQGTLAITTDQAGANVIATAGGVGVAGDNELTITEAVGNTIWLSRDGTNNTWNGVVDAIYVTRSCAISDDCSIKTLTINGEAITPAEKVFSYEVAAASALTEVAVAYTIHPLATGTPASGFNIAVPAAGDPANTQTITVTAEDGTHSDTYTVSVSKAASASNVVTLDALGVTGYTLDPAFDAGTLAYTITKAYGAEDPGTDKVTYTKTETEQTVGVAYDGTNHKLTVTVTAEDNTTTQDYVITINEAEAPKSLSRVLFSNGFDAFIDNTNHTVKAYYLAGTSVPTATTITAGAGTPGEYAEGKITVTGADASTVDYIVTLAEVTPNTTTVAEEAAAGEFAGDEAWVKNGLLIYGNAAGYDGGDGKKWYVNRRLTKGTDPEDDQRVIAGWVRSYFFVGNTSKFIMTVGGNNAVKYAIDGGEQVANASGTLEISLTKGNHMIEIVSNQSNGDCRLSAPKLVEFPPTYAVTYSAGDGSVKGGESLPTQEAVEAGAVITLASADVLEKDGYVFDGWLCDVNSTKYNAGAEYTMTAVATTFTAQWVDASYAAQIGSTKYATLEAALEHAADGTIELLRNINTEAQIEIAEGVTATIDLAGYKIEYTGTSTLPSGVLLVHNGASLTIDDSSDPDAGSIVAGNKAYAAIALTKAGDNAANPAILVINGGIFTGYYYAITGNGSRHNTQITINAGTFTGTAANDNNAIYHPQEGTLTINNGNFTGYLSAIEMRAGTLEINDGTFTATATEYSCNPSGSGTTTVGAAIAIAQHNTQKDIAVTINGGTFEGVKAINEANPQGNPAPAVAMSVTGGDFTGELSTIDVDNFVSAGSFSAEVPVEYCANGYIPAPVDPVTGKYTVKEGWKVTFVDGMDEEIVAVDKDAPVAEKAMSGKIGYTFDGWLNGVDLYDFTANVTADLTLNAKWTAFDGCTDLWPAASGDALNVGDNVNTQTGSTGGSIAVVGMKNAGSSIAYNEDGLYLSGGSADIISVTLNNDMKVGTKISVTLKSGNTGQRGLTLLNATGGNVAGGTTLGWDDATIGAVETFSYTVTASDGLDGTNVFRLKRSNSVFLQCVRVESCGDAIIYHNLTSAVNIAGKGIVTLGASSVREGYTTTAEYSDIDPLYEFVSWSVSGEGASVDNATANPATITVGTEDAVVTLNVQLIPVKFTVNYYDGETLKGSELVAVNENPTASEINTSKRHFTFQGWAETDGGSVVALNTITSDVAATINLYAVYAPVACPTEGTVFSMEFDNTKTPTSTVKVAKNGGSLDLADYATLVGGNAVIENTETSDKDAISTDGKFKLTATKEIMRIELECAIATGDVIRIPDNNAKYVLSTSNAKTGTYQAQTSSQHEFEATAAWNGVDDLYILYDGSSLNFTKVYVLRPYTISFDLQGHGDAIDVQKLVEGKKIVAPTAPTADGWDFGGWYKEAACTNAWDFDNDVVDGTMSLFAKWSEHVTNDATLKSLKYGTTAITLEDGIYTYNVELAAAVAAVPALSAETNADLANALITNAEAFVAGQATSTVLVTAEDGATQLLYTVNFTKEASIALQDVTGNMTWDFSKANDGSAAGSELCTDEVLANVAGIVNNSDFKSDNIKATANKFSSGKLQASMIKFHTTVPGAVIVKCSNTGSSKPMRYLYVNGVQTELGSTNGTVQTYAEYVPAGDVVLTVMPTTETGTVMFNFTSVEFKVDNDLEPARTDEWLAPGELGTICIPQGAVAVGADIYELVGKEPQYGKIVFETVEHMKPGKPYLFQAKGNRIDFILTDEAEASEPDNSGAMKGTFVNLDLTELENVYYFAGHALWSCVDLTSLSVPANRAYVKLDEVEALQSPNPAPGRRRITLGVNGQNTATGLENLVGGEQAQKLLIDGQMYILRGEKLYDATGRLVK